MMNHEIEVVCLYCEHTFDAHLHGLHCPNCGRKLHEGEYEFE